MTLRIGSLFSGYGGLDLGVQRVFGGEVQWHVEFDAAPSKILAHHWPDVPNYGDVRSVDWASVPPVDILTGGFPCQDVSLAGRRVGLTNGTRSGLWSEYARAIDILRPEMVVIENVRGLLSAEAAGAVEPDPWGMGDGSTRPTLNAFGVVLGDLAGLRYDARWVGVRAADAGAPHGRFRVFVLAHPPSLQRGLLNGNDVQARGATVRRVSDSGSGSLADTDRNGRQEFGWLNAAERDSDRSRSADSVWGAYQPAIWRWEQVMHRTASPPQDPSGRVNPAFVEWMQGLPEGHVTAVPGLSREQQLRALGNGVVPQQAALALRLLLQPVSGLQVAA